MSPSFLRSVELTKIIKMFLFHSFQTLHRCRSLLWIRAKRKWEKKNLSLSKFNPLIFKQDYILLSRLYCSCDSVCCITFILRLVSLWWKFSSDKFKIPFSRFFSFHLLKLFVSIKSPSVLFRSRLLEVENSRFMILKFPHNEIVLKTS